MGDHTVKLTFTLKVPNVPNFIFIDTDKAIVDSHDKISGVKISIADLDQDDLKRIGELWTQKLIDHAAHLRTQSPGPTVRNME